MQYKSVISDESSMKYHSLWSLLFFGILFASCDIIHNTHSYRILTKRTTNVNEQFDNVVSRSYIDKSCLNST